MKKIISLTALIWYGCATSLTAQQFSFHANSPFGIQQVKPDMTRAAQQIMFYDYDGDGDLDAFLSGLDFIDDFENWEDFHFFLEMQVNTGTKYAPQFSDRVSVIDSFPYPVGYFLPTIGDLNADGWPDFIIGAAIHPEIGTQKQQMLIQHAPPQPAGFTVSNLDQFDLLDFATESAFRPELVDLDRDGDLDLMNSGFNSAFAEEDGPDVPIFHFARNAGSPASPIYEGWYTNPYAMIPDPHGEIISSGDIDNDNDIDFVGGLIQTPVDSNFYLTMHINSPDQNGRPGFNAPLHSPFGLPTSFGESQLTFPELADLDGDGDQDLFVFRGDASGQALEYYVNDLCHSFAEVSESICEGESVVVGGMEFSAPGEYTIHTTAHNNCDSVIHLVVTVEPFVEVLMESTICPGESIVVGGMVFNESGQYMLTVPGNTGCDTLIMLDLTVDTLLLTSYETTICFGQEFPFGGDIFSQEGEYDVQLPAAVGCDTLAHLTLHVEMVDAGVTLNEHILTADAGGANYQWLDCGNNEPISGATGQTYNVLATGSYAVVITSAIGCMVQSACTEVIITSVSGNNEAALRLYPNPTNGLVYFDGVSMHGEMRVSVLDATGRIVRVQTMDNSRGLDLTGQPSGLYFVRVESGDRMMIGKVVMGI